MAKPLLHIFAISHYCEKARWALDHLDVVYDLNVIAPVAHSRKAKRLGLSAAALPILETADGAVQGSARIIDWADGAAAGDKAKLTPADDQLCRAIESRLDDALGIHVRRYYYSEAVIEYPQSVKQIFIEHLPPMQKRLVSFGWGKICKFMIASMDLGKSQGLESKNIVEAELDWLDSLLSDGRNFLIDNQFSRTDITAASLLAPLVTPPEHPTYSGLTLPPGVAAAVAAWQDRPSFTWARDIYARWR